MDEYVVIYQAMDMPMGEEQEVIFPTLEAAQDFVQYLWCYWYEISNADGEVLE